VISVEEEALTDSQMGEEEDISRKILQRGIYPAVKPLPPPLSGFMDCYVVLKFGTWAGFFFSHLYHVIG
jgi:hypothetical protein